MNYRAFIFAAMPALTLNAFFSFWRFAKKIIANPPGVSSAIWIPTLWIGILLSKPLSLWVNASSTVNTLEGSPLDRWFYFTLIFAALVVLLHRRILWSSMIFKNWPIFLFYAFLLASVLWTNSPPTSFKRWLKEFGNIFVLLVILTEANPQQALRAVFVRCAYVLIPLSMIFIRWFPALGRTYNIHSGAMEAIGVTTQKNSLGAMILVCSIIILWGWLARRKEAAAQAEREPRSETIARAAVLLIGVWLLLICDSKTSMICLAIAAGILIAAQFSFFQRRLKMLCGLTLAVALALVALDQAFHFKDQFLRDLGRDATFTGRTDVWQELRNAGTDPLLGTGFMSFWDDQHYRAKLPDWVSASAHNGYLEIYLAGGWVGVFLLSTMLLFVGWRINQSLASGSDYAIFRFAVYIVTLVANFMESNFACMTPIGFLFLLAAIGSAETVLSVERVSMSRSMTKNLIWKRDAIRSATT